MSPFSLIGSADLAARINSYDWASTPLGPLEGWPQSLRTALSIILGSRFPMQLLWGPQYIHFYNDAYIPIAADKHPAALGRPGAEVWPEVWEQVLPNLARVRATGEASWSDDELLVLDRNGGLEEGYFTFSYSPVFDEHGVGGVLVAVTETTRRVLGERRLNTIRELGASLAGLVDEGAAMRAAESSLARNPNDLPFVLCYTRDDSSRPFSLAWSCGVPPGHPAAAAGPVWPLADLQPDGEPRYVEGPLAALPPLLAAPWGVPVTAACLLPLDKPGARALLGFLVVGLSPRLRPDSAYLEFLGRLAAQLSGALAAAHAHAQANQAVRVRDDFLSIAAHELKTPLTPIVGRLLLTRRRLGKEGIAQRHLDDLERIAAEAGRLADLIDVLLDVTQLRSGQLLLSHQPVDLGELAAMIAAEFQITFASHTFTLSRDEGPLTLVGDGVRLGQVVRNLISNAVKYSQDGGAVRLHVGRSGDGLSLSVEDEGVGIAPELVSRIFERYYRVDTPTSAGIGGLGIGLFVVHEIVRLHGGVISVESALGAGSRFTVTLPAAVERPTEGAVLRPAR